MSASLLKEGMANIIGTPRSTPFFRRCLKPGEELQEPQRPMYKPDSAYNSQQVYTESQNHFVHSNNMHRGRVGSMSSIGSGGYHSDANSHHSASSGYPNRSHSMDSVQTQPGLSLFDGLDVAGMPQRQQNNGHNQSFSHSADYPHSSYGAHGNLATGAYPQEQSQYLENNRNYNHDGYPDSTYSYDKAHQNGGVVGSIATTQVCLDNTVRNLRARIIRPTTATQPTMWSSKIMGLVFISIRMNTT